MLWTAGFVAAPLCHRSPLLASCDAVIRSNTEGAARLLARRGAVEDGVHTLPVVGAAQLVQVGAGGTQDDTYLGGWVARQRS